MIIYFITFGASWLTKMCVCLCVCLNCTLAMCSENRQRNLTFHRESVSHLSDTIMAATQQRSCYLRGPAGIGGSSMFQSSAWSRHYPRWEKIRKTTRTTLLSNVVWHLVVLQPRLVPLSFAGRPYQLPPNCTLKIDNWTTQRFSVDVCKC